MDSSTNSMYSVDPTVFKDDGPEPVKLFLDGIDEQKKSLEAARDKKRMASAKRMDAADKSLLALKASGWREHDRARQLKRDEIRDQYKAWQVETEGDPFSGKDGQERFRQFNESISNYNMFEEYSGQIQSETESSIAEAVKNPDLYTEESINNLNDYVSKGYDYQVKEGLPILEKREAEVDAMDFLIKKNRPGSFAYSSSKPTDDGTRSSSGTSTPSENISAMDDPYIDKWFKAKKKTGKSNYYDSLLGLHEDSWLKTAEAEAYDNTDESIDESGYNEFEREELNYMKAQVLKTREAGFNKSHGSTVTKSKVKAGDSKIEPAGSVAATTYIDGRFQGGSRTGNVVDAIPLKKTPIEINPASFVEVSSDGQTSFTPSNSNQMKFVPGRMYSGVPVFQGPGTIEVGGIELYPGDMIPKGSYESLDSATKDKFNTENVVEGTIIRGGTGMFDEKSNSTIRVREVDIKTRGLSKPLEDAEFNDLLDD
jgi:hypothetical protein